jgi:hypothetical protein
MNTRKFGAFLCAIGLIVLIGGFIWNQQVDKRRDELAYKDLSARLDHRYSQRPIRALREVEDALQTTTRLMWAGGIVLTLGFGLIISSGNSASDRLRWASNETADNVAALLAMRDATVNGDVKAATELLDKGVDANDHYKGIPWLHMACLNGHLDVVELLLQRGGDKTLADEYGVTPAQHAQRAGHTRIVALLTKHRPQG